MLRAPAPECEERPLDGLDTKTLEALNSEIDNCIQAGKPNLQSFHKEIKKRLGLKTEDSSTELTQKQREEQEAAQRKKLLEAHARGVALALGAGGPEPSPIDPGTRELPSNKGLFDSSTAPAAVTEALSLVTDIAVKRAKQHGLGFLKSRLEAAVCGVTLPYEDVRILPATCELVGKSSPDKLVGDPRVIQVALFQDLLELLVTQRIEPHILTGPSGDSKSGSQGTTDPAGVDIAAAPQKPDDAATKAAKESLRSLARLAIRIGARTLSKRDFALTVDDARTLLSAIVDTAGLHKRSRIQWGKARAIPYGLAAAALWNKDTSGTLPELIRALESAVIGEAPANPPPITSAAASGEAQPASPPPTTSSAASDKSPLSADEFARALEIANLALIAASATGAERLPDGRERLIAAIDLVFECIGEYVRFNVCETQSGPCTAHARTRQVHAIVHAAVDRDVQNAVSAAVRLLLDLDATPPSAPKTPDEASVAQEQGDSEEGTATAAHHREYARRTEKAAALIVAIAAYADTYAPRKSSEAAGTDQPTPEELRKKRQAVLEGLIDATTVRDRRHGEWVFSLGIPVGFSTGFQYIRERERDAAGDPVLDAQGRPQDTWSPMHVMYPQLELPLGFAAQKLVGQRYVRGYERGCERETDRPARCKSWRPRPHDARMRFDGVHLFASMIDLGQFLALDEKGKLSRPRWDSFISPGAQVGWIFGRPQNSFILGVEGRYAPTLFAGTSELTIPADAAPGGAARFGIFVAYYISLFDFN